MNVVILYCYNIFLTFLSFFFFASRRRHTCCALLTGVQTCALPISGAPALTRSSAPHSFAFSAERWYVRAWSRGHNDFRDYNLNRIGAIRDAKPAVVEPSADFEWINMIDLIIAPNPGLPEAKRAAVVAEYNMVGEQLRVPCRIRLSFYLMSEHNLDLEPGRFEPAKQQ